MADSIGIDIVSCSRISADIDRFGEKFADRILGEDERLLYDRRPDPVQFLAGRLAAKEALVKALGKYLEQKPPFAKLQIVNDDKGRPIVLPDNEWIAKLPPVEILVSISHEREYAAAVAVITEA